MKTGLTLVELVREIAGGTVEGRTDVWVNGVHHDSRRVVPGDLFVARRGASHDGLAFVPQAIANGAAAVLVDRDAALDVKVPIVRVDDVPAALALAAAAVYGHPAFSLDIVGVTGTNGKTTTTHLLRTAIDGSFGRPQCGIVGTLGHSFGGVAIPSTHTTPEADELARVLAEMRSRGATHVAMEVSSIALMLARVHAVRFRVAAFTNLTQDHLDFHGTMEAYAAAKMKLFTDLAPGLAVVNVDDPFGVKIVDATNCTTLRVRTTPGATDGDVVAETVEIGPSGMRIVAKTPSGTFDFTTRLVGLHNVENLLVTLGVCAALELEVDRAVAALENDVGAPGRLERCDGPDDDVMVLVDYAHTPDALERVLDAVKLVAAKKGGGRVLCVFGCGGDRDPSKRGPMGDAVGRKADVAIVTSDNPRTEDPAAIAAPVIEAVRAAGKTPEVELDRKKAIAMAIEQIARPGDIVLLAGKGHEDYQIVGTEKRPFDDRVEAKAALTRRRSG